MSIQTVRGSLLASDFVARELAATFPDPAAGARAAAFRRLRQWHARTRPALGPVSSVRTIVDRAALPIFDALGYALRDVRHLDQESGQSALLCAGSAGTVGLVVIPWGAPLAGAWRPAVRHAMHAGVHWSFVFNGRTIRVVDARRTYARHFLEFDLEAATHDEAGFAPLWLLLHAHRFDRGPTTNEPAFDRIVRASERHAAAVRGALQEGVHEALETLLDAFVRATTRRPVRSPHHATLARPGSSIESLFDHSLVVVYRVLFLLFAEARRLVPVWHPVYRDAYTIEALQKAVDGRDPPKGLWEALQAIARLAHHGCTAGDLRVTAFNGRLFAPQGAPLADLVKLDELSVRQALASLIFARTKAGGRHRVAYVDLGVEQLGAVYERVLEYEAAPVTQAGSRPNSEVAVPRVQLLVKGARRKASGTFYTPRSLTDFLVRRTLHPLVRGASAQRILELRVLDPAMGSGAFLVGACRYLSTAYEAALIREGTLASHEIDDQARAAFRRLIAQRCLFGVDLNPVASQLARLSLWLATLAVDRPLTFLDHHLRVGDSLLGASIGDLFRQPPGSASRAMRPAALPLLELADLQVNVRSILPDRHALSMRADDTPGIVREKEALLERLDARDSALGRWKASADLWCAGWFWPSSLPRRTYLALSDEIRLRRSWLPPTIAAPLLAEARSIAKARRFFHWTLEFPEVFFDEDGQPLADGGFDAVLGNPPWDMMRADTGDAARRTEGRALQSQTVRFARAAGVYCAHSHGHVNRYQLFVERALSLVRRGGRLGLVVPIGLATDHSSAALRRLLFSRAAIDTMIGFDNRAGIFPIHRGVRFLVSTATAGTETTRLRCRFGERDAAVLDAMADDPDEDPHDALPVTLTREFLSRVSGEDCTVPELRSPSDVALFDKLTSLAPALADDKGWGARFGRELNASDDREHFHPRQGRSRNSGASTTSASGTEAGPTGRAGTAGRLLPVLDGKHVTPFRVDIDASVIGIDAASAARLLDRARTFGRSRIAYRDVAASTNRLTLIAAVVPPDAVTTHTLFCMKTNLDGPSQAFLCGVLNSFVANYLVRPRVSTHVTVALVERLPVPRPTPGTLMGAIADEIGLLAAALATPDCPSRERVAARLQALAAHLYGLTATELRHILSTFPLVDAAEKALVYEMYCRIDRLSVPLP